MNKNILYSAIKESTQIIKSYGADRLVVFKPVNQASADTILIN